MLYARAVHLDYQTPKQASHISVTFSTPVQTRFFQARVLAACSRVPPNGAHLHTRVYGFTAQVALMSATAFECTRRSTCDESSSSANSIESEVILFAFTADSRPDLTIEYGRQAFPAPS